MSYPEPRYLEETPMVGGVLRSSGRDPDLVYPSGGTVHYLATGAMTGGDFGLYRWNMAPEPSGPSPHFHRTMSESFFVLAGTVRLYDGESWQNGAPGDFLHVPPGGIHGFRNESGEAASMLILFTPGAPREEYFETLARLRAGETMTEDELREFYIRHDNLWVDTPTD